MDNTINLTPAQLERLIKFTEAKISKWSSTKICSVMGLNKKMFPEIRLSGDTSTGYSFGHFIQFNTEYLSGYYFRDTSYSIKFFLRKNYKGEFTLGQSSLSRTQIKVPAKLIAELGIENNF